MFVVYILFSARFNKIYIGQTGSLISRFHSHNSLAKKGALKREKELKSGKGRAWVRESLELQYLTRGFISA